MEAGTERGSKQRWIAYAFFHFYIVRDSRKKENAENMWEMSKKNNSWAFALSVLFSICLTKDIWERWSLIWNFVVIHEVLWSGKGWKMAKVYAWREILKAFIEIHLGSFALKPEAIIYDLKVWNAIKLLYFLTWKFL